jgi:DNA segregation ATPase FtsK/SpoIIIE-like protein
MKRQYIKPYKQQVSVDDTSIVLRKLPVKVAVAEFNWIVFLIPVITTILFYIAAIYSSNQANETGSSIYMYFLIVPIITFIIQLIMYKRSIMIADKKYEVELQNYLAYLDDVEKESQERNNTVKEYYRTNYPPFENLREQIKQLQQGEQISSHFIWNTLPEHSEFLTLRIGTYDRTSPIRLDDTAIHNSDNTQIRELNEINSKVQIIKSYHTISNSPYIVNLRETPYVAIKGGQKTHDFVNTIVLNMLSYHAYDDVRLAIYRTGETKHDDFLRHLPHIWNEQGDFRYHVVAKNDPVIDSDNKQSDTQATQDDDEQIENQNKSLDEINKDSVPHMPSEPTKLSLWQRFIRWITRTQKSSTLSEPITTLSAGESITTNHPVQDKPKSDTRSHIERIYGNKGNADKNKYEIFDRLETILKSRSLENSKQVLPHYILVVEDTNEFFSHSIHTFFTSSSSNLGFSIIFVLNSEDVVPAICSLVVDFDRTVQQNYNIVQNAVLNNEVQFKPEVIDITVAESIARVLANVELVTSKVASHMPKEITFFDILKTDALQTDILRKTWQKNKNSDNLDLTVTIGITANLNNLEINLRDGKDGPHAIIAGMTGSGKSELLQTLILALCVNYSPEQVSFAFIDFKAGGLADQFVHVPHTSGILTNKTNNTAYFANRAITMLKQEKKYRSELLGEYNLDIHRYQKACRNNRSLPPLPHLFVIIDESAEVVDQFNEFMHEMVSLARVGRSMGIHLILSTQNPSRTVDKQIFDNANLKICLSVLSEEESKAILKTGDAANISQRGRAYLLTGNAERYELFQSAYTGAKSTKNISNLDADPYIVGPDGIMKNFAIEVSGELSEQTQISVVIDKLLESGKKNAHTVFSPALKNSLYLHDMQFVNADQHAFFAVIGSADVLEEQQSRDVIIDFDKNRNLVIYGMPRSGKTTLMQTMLVDLAQRYNDGNKLQIIVAATSTSQLKQLANASFVSECLTESNALHREKLVRLPKLLLDITQERKAALQEAGCNTFAEYTQKNPQHTMPRIVIFIDNLSHFSFEDELVNFVDELAKLFTAGSANVGIHFITTYEGRVLPRNVIMHFDCRVWLQIHGDMAYTYDCAFNGIIENFPGRGVYNSAGSDIYHEIQVYQPSLHHDTTKLNFNDLSSHIQSNSTPSRLPFTIKTARDMLLELGVTTKQDAINTLTKSQKTKRRTEGFPIGVYFQSLASYDISKHKPAYLFSIVGDTQNIADWKLFLNKQCSQIGSVIYYDEKDRPLSNIDSDINTKFQEATNKGKHIFVIVSYLNETFNEFSNTASQKQLLDLIQSTEYKNNCTLIVVTFARLAARNTVLTQYCVDQNSIVCIGGKHDQHVRFADVSSKVVGIAPGNAYVSTSSINFEQVVLTDVFS